MQCASASVYSVHTAYQSNLLQLYTLGNKYNTHKPTGCISRRPHHYNVIKNKEDLGFLTVHKDNAGLLFCNFSLLLLFILFLFFFYIFTYF